ncbi:MAG: hypothetical protein Q9166_008143 [cf. Caloplaca sp. 2 TL-2023]
MASLLRSLGLAPLNLWKVLAILFGLLNLKHLPFAWHFRIINGLLQYLPILRKPHPLPSLIGPPALFRPLLVASRSSPVETDYNLHKSNSTYFSDFDIGRLHLLMCLCHTGIVATGHNLWVADNKQGPKRLSIMMGGVSMHFRREIKPLQSFEMWTRILSWDRKWIYTVTYFIKKGAVKPKGWLLQPWRNKDPNQTRTQTPPPPSSSNASSTDGIGNSTNGKAQEKEEKRTGPHPAIFATGIAKYVAKRGRLTIPPELIFQNSGLLPPKPASHSPPPATDTPAAPLEGDTLPTAPAEALQDITSSKAEEMLDAALNDSTEPNQKEKEKGGGKEDEEWTWEKVERERQKGLRIAEAWNMTEKLSEGFDGDEGMALGKYWDFP